MVTAVLKEKCDLKCIYEITKTKNTCNKYLNYPLLKCVSYSKQHKTPEVLKNWLHKHFKHKEHKTFINKIKWQVIDWEIDLQHTFRTKVWYLFYIKSSDKPVRKRHNVEKHQRRGRTICNRRRASQWPHEKMPKVNNIQGDAFIGSFHKYFLNTILANK